MKKQREKILVFEDTDIEFETTRDALHREGYHVIRASSPAEFANFAPFSEFVMAVVDFYYGPVKEKEGVGITLTTLVKQKNPTLPVLVVSSLEPSRQEVVEAFRAGAWDYADKEEFWKDVPRNLKRIRDASLDDDIRAEEQFPLPIAFLLRGFRRTLATPKQRLERMVELFEVTLKTVTFVLLSAHRANLSSILPRDVRMSLERPSLGHFTKLLSVLPEAEGFLSSLSKVTARSQFRVLCQDLISVRNEYIAHGVRQVDAVYEKVLEENASKMMDLLHMLHQLRQWRIIKPSGVKFLDKEFVYDSLVFKGSNPDVPIERLQTKLALRPTDHVHLLDESLEHSVDLYPWFQYLTCEQVCLSEKLFIYRLCREGELWALDHVYGHALQSSSGYGEVRKIVYGTVGEEEP